MFDVPDPLHVAIVHFPIVFIFVGAVFALLSIFTRRGALPQFTALFLVFAAGSAQYAVITGRDQAKEVLQRKPAAKTLIQHHKEWGNRTRTVVAVAAVSALLALVFIRFRGFYRSLAFVTTLLAIGACYCVIAASERGGEMVYQHGVGLQTDDSMPVPAPTSTPVPTIPPQAMPSPSPEEA